MEDTLPWKIIFVATSFSLLILGFAYYLITPRDMNYFISENSDKITRIKNIRLAGRNEGKKVWEFFAEEGQLGKNREVTQLFKIKDGKLYKDGKRVVNSISAAYLKYFPERKMVTLTGEVTLKRKDLTLRCPSIDYLSAEDKVNAYNGVSIEIREKGSASRIKCGSASFYGDMDKEMVFHDALEITQGKKIVLAKEGSYFHKENELRLRGKVKAVFEKAEALIKEETADKLKNPETRKLLKEKTILSADQLDLSTKTGDAKAYGSVHVVQKEKEARADQAVYDDKEETMVLTGNVSLKKKDDWVKAEKVLVSVRNETFEAVGSVEAEFKL